MTRLGTWLKMLGVGTVISVGGPMFVQYIRPSEEELFKKYNPELQKKSLENRERREKEFDDYVNKLKEWSKSDKSIWFAAKEEEARRRAAMESQASRANEEERIQREEMRRELQGRN
ncbi:hypothetical protein VTN96DRAFT_9719 [Rasamsonia emersonii]|uniref:Cytochrome b mRNA-processing protein 4 n=1 Tax=Rasamsonia emersonii (strain ATCC 16479 / CBS 393.64 / IMI 116815) TaxID=1408163 RepID=A0A0F4YJC9_RASE3|nr:Assembly factor cbp4 [Rasamsonia emersonii CBS 393.64]KKA18402.1 Assembly factor cbp4 [Rasamsonia emersonii CBS 393.64]